MMQKCVRHLMNSAFIINAKLHSKQLQNITSKFSSVDIDKESKNIRRNSQYKTAAVLLIYYVIYSAYHGTPPTNVNFEACRNKGDENVLPIQHFNKFKNYTYTYEMVLVVDAGMLHMVRFGITEFYHYCGTFLAINLAIKKKEKQISYKKRKKINAANCHEDDDDVTPSTSGVFDFEDLDFADGIVKEDLETTDTVVDEYVAYSIPELKEMSKEPNVLMKFYQAWLLECDWEVLLLEIRNCLTTRYPHAQMIKLLLYIISIIGKTVHTTHTKQIHMEKLDSLLKENAHIQVVDRLLAWTRTYKYSEFSISDYQAKDDKHFHDTKNFQLYRRNTRNIFCFTSEQQLNLKFGTYECNSYNGINTSYTVLEYVLKQQKFLFDLIYITNTSKNDLNKMTWPERLNLLRQVSQFKDHIVINVRPISFRQIQYDKYPWGTAVYYYIRTGGLGVGTLFLKHSKTNTKSRICNLSAIRRHRRTIAADLKMTSGSFAHEISTAQSHGEPFAANSSQSIPSVCSTNIDSSIFLNSLISASLQQTLQQNQNAFNNALKSLMNSAHKTPCSSPAATTSLPTFPVASQPELDGVYADLLKTTQAFEQASSIFNANCFLPQNILNTNACLKTANAKVSSINCAPTSSTSSVATTSNNGGELFF